MKLMVIGLIAMVAVVLTGCDGQPNPLVPPPAPPPPAAPPAPPAPPAAPAAPKPGQGKVTIGGIDWMHAGGNKYSAISAGCFPVPDQSRVDTPNGSYFGGERVNVSVATLYVGGEANAPQPRRTCDITGAVAPQPQAQPAAAPAPAAAAPAASGVDPAADLGGTWRHVTGNQWSLAAPATIKGHSSWVVHTPRHPGDPGLPSGQSEAVSAATAYRK